LYYCSWGGDRLKIAGSGLIESDGARTVSSIKCTFSSVVLYQSSFSYQQTFVIELSFFASLIPNC